MRIDTVAIVDGVLPPRGPFVLLPYLPPSLRVAGVARRAGSAENKLVVCDHTEPNQAVPSLHGTVTGRVNSRLMCATFSLRECAIGWGTVSANR